MRLKALLVAVPMSMLTAGTAVAADTTALVTESAVSPGISVKSDGWISYAPQVTSTTGTTVTVAGTRSDDGGCTLTGDASSGPDTYTEEVGYNPATCQFKLRTTTGVAPATTAGPVSTTADTSLNSLTTKTTVDSLATTDSLAAAAVYTYKRYLKTSWIDPINITISSQTVAFQWTNVGWTKWAYARNSFKGCVAGACLDKTYIVSGSDSFTALTGGWRKTANVHFRNTSFAKWVAAVLGLTGWAACGFPTSFQADFYHQDQVSGYKSGAWATHWSDSKSGACTNLVHHGDATGASYPL